MRTEAVMAVVITVLARHGTVPGHIGNDGEVQILSTLVDADTMILNQHHSTLNL